MENTNATSVSRATLDQGCKTYFKARPTEERRNKRGAVIMPSGWSVIGKLIHSNGEFSLEVFRLKSPMKLASVIVNEHSFNDLFAKGIPRKPYAASCRTAGEFAFVERLDFTRCEESSPQNASS